MWRGDGWVVWEGKVGGWVDFGRLCVHVYLPFKAMAAASLGLSATMCQVQRFSISFQSVISMPSKPISCLVRLSGWVGGWVGEFG